VPIQTLHALVHPLYIGAEYQGMHPDDRMLHPSISIMAGKYLERAATLPPEDMMVVFSHMTASQMTAPDNYFSEIYVKFREALGQKLGDRMVFMTSEANIFNGKSLSSDVRHALSEKRLEMDRQTQVIVYGETLSVCVKGAAFSLKSGFQLENPPIVEADLTDGIFWWQSEPESAQEAIRGNFKSSGLVFRDPKFV
jgi:hypothetical protein